MEKEIESIISIAKQLTVQDGAFEPMLFVYGDKGKAFTLFSEFPFDTFNQRREAYFLIGKRFKSVNAVGSLTDLVSLSEAWVGTNINVQPSKDSNKKEVLLISHFNVKTKTSSIQMTEFIRDQDGRPIDFRDIAIPKGIESEDNLAPAFVMGYTQ